MNQTNVQFGGLIREDVLRTEAGLNLSGAEFGENIDIKFNALNMPFLIDKQYGEKNELNQLIFKH